MILRFSLSQSKHRYALARTSPPAAKLQQHTRSPHGKGAASPAYGEPALCSGISPWTHGPVSIFDFGGSGREPSNWSARQATLRCHLCCIDRTFRMDRHAPPVGFLTFLAEKRSLLICEQIFAFLMRPLLTSPLCSRLKVRGLIYLSSPQRVSRAGRAPPLRGNPVSRSPSFLTFLCETFLGIVIFTCPSAHARTLPYGPRS